MNELLIIVVGGIIVAILINIFGIGSSTRVKIQGGYKPSKTGKWIIILSVLMILGGLSWASGHPTPINSRYINTGYAVAIWGVYF